MNNKVFDITIIGAGAVGCAIARELARYELSIAVIEKNPDVAGETSGRNSAVVHAGFNNQPGSLMARLCVEGSNGFEALCTELDVPYKKTGKYLVAYDESDEKVLNGLIARGAQNGCKGLHLISGDEMHEIIPEIKCLCAMHSPETAIIDPFLYCIALAENAQANGVQFFLSHTVKSIKKEDKLFSVSAGGKHFFSQCLINSAGLSAAHISDLAGVHGYKIYPCRGEYFILDTIAENTLPVPVYPAPKNGIGGLGIHLTPTIHGNIIIGPSAEYIDLDNDYSTTKRTMDTLWNEAKKFLPSLSSGNIIGGFAGIRPKTSPPSEGGFHDFIIKEEQELPGLINLIGIESPGLTASIPIGRMVCDIVANILTLNKKSTFNGIHHRPLCFRTQSIEKQNALVKEDPKYGEVVCRCQTVTKREICDAIENPLGVHTLAGIKYRAWCTTGRCQGSYCLSRISTIMRDEYGIAPKDIMYRGGKSYLFTGEVK